MNLCNYCFTVIQKFVVSVFHPLGGIGVETLIGGCRERVTSCSGFLGADATERGEEPTTTKAKLVVIVGYIKGKPFISLHARYGTPS